MAMSEKDELVELLDYLSAKEISTLKNLVELMAEKSSDRRETREFLKISETAFSEWDNEEDDVYNDL